MSRETFHKLHIIGIRHEHSKNNGLTAHISRILDNKDTLIKSQFSNSACTRVETVSGSNVKVKWPLNEF